MNGEVAITTTAAPGAETIQAYVAPKTEASLMRMFADPRLLEQEERRELVTELRASVAASPGVSELRVLLGMALCVDLQVEDAIEELKEGVRLAPHSFIAQLKMGELWMRLRVCDKAADHTRQAALLARSALQSELARQQAAKIRELLRHGLERGGFAYGGAWRALSSAVSKVWKRRSRRRLEALATTESL